MAGFWEMVDSAAHFLHTPTMRRGVTVARWHHRIHLLPVCLLNPICDRFDLSLGMTRDELRRKAPAVCPHILSYSGVTDVHCGCGGQVVQNVSKAGTP